MSIDIATLNVKLSTLSYLGGCYPSAEDATTFQQIKYDDLKHAPHVKRWYNHICSFTENERSQWPSADKGKKADDKKEEDDFDLFGDDDEDSEEERRREEDFDRRAREAQARIDAKKAKSGKVEIAKSMGILDVKTYDDETPLEGIAKQVIAIEMDGLKWGECLLTLLPSLYTIFSYRQIR